MTSFTPRKSPTAATLDPTKHVNFTQGMVLGVDDFTQEFAYLSGRDTWMARDLIGYGTVSGLHIAIERSEVVVEPGVAVNPRGQLIRVTAAQCANLNKWLSIDRNRQKLGVPIPNMVRLSAVLCFRECPTDAVPIPGEPCRSEEDTVAPSRLKDDFRLELRFNRPPQTEEDALRAFVNWLTHTIEFTDRPEDFVDIGDVVAAILAAADRLELPALSPEDFPLESPPLLLRVHREQACDLLRAVARVWITRLRPRWQAHIEPAHYVCGEPDVDSEPEEADCLLLGELHVPLTPDGRVADFAAVRIDEERRPLLLYLRMLQELLLCGPCCGYGAAAREARTFASLSIADPSTVRVGLHHQDLLDDQAGGDLGGTFPAPSVRALQGRRVLSNQPNLKDVLTWTGNQWEPQAVPQAVPPLGLSLPFVTVTRLGSSRFEFWFNIDEPDNRAEIQQLEGQGTVLLFEETDQGPDFITPINILSIARPAPPMRNVFLVTAEREAERLRFLFRMDAVQILVNTSTISAREYAERRSIRFNGHDGASTLTAFVRVQREIPG